MSFVIASPASMTAAADLADLAQPDLRVLVKLGYNPNGYADVPTPAQLWPGFTPLAGLLRLAQPQLNALGV